MITVEPVYCDRCDSMQEKKKEIASTTKISAFIVNLIQQAPRFALFRPQTNTKTCPRKCSENMRDAPVRAENFRNSCDCHRVRSQLK